MTIPPEVAYPVLVAGVGAGVAWIKSVESRLSATQAIIDKIDHLVTLLLEDRLDQRNPRPPQSRPQAR